MAAMTPIRQAIARRMSASWTTVPHFFVSTDIDMGALTAALRDRDGGRPVGVSAAVIRATVLTLAEEPAFNAHWTDDGPAPRPDINVGVAIAVPGGLIAPAILHAEALDAVGVAAALADLAERARQGRARSRELTDGTFTVSNLGGFDVSSFAAIVTAPQVAILATGRAQPRPVAVGDQVVVRPVMTATLSADHRALDGADSARFLQRLKALLEAPEPWLDALPSAPASHP